MRWSRLGNKPYRSWTAQNGLNEALEPSYEIATPTKVQGDSGRMSDVTGAVDYRLRRNLRIVLTAPTPVNKRTSDDGSGTVAASLMMLYDAAKPVMKPGSFGRGM
jgi:hypothetical protein